MEKENTRVTLVGIIVEDPEAATRINGLLHEYGEYIIGRMGIPYHEKQMNIISVVMDAPQEKVSALYLEFDDARSGGFECLKYISEDKKVVLGLITTKSPKLEDKNAVIARIQEAAKYVPLDRLYLSPQCGFASCEIGNKLTEEEQWAKLKLVKEIAEEVWG